ncbi:MAG: hypothetical protein JW936_00430 [Sedimentisphaerales bacterium]|nr:hypothetical protein [Sedimentisphaerales bacterium]
MDLLRKMLYTGIGLAALSEEKAKEMVAELEKKGEVSSEEGKKLAQELIEKAKKQGEELQRVVKTEVGKVTDKIKGVSRDEFKALEARVAALEARLGGGSEDSL